MEIEPHVKKAIDDIRDYYIKNYTDEEKHKLFNNLDKVTYVRNTLKGYTSINRVKAKHIHGDPPYELFYNYDINEKFVGFVNKYTDGYLINLIRWLGVRTGPRTFRLVCGYNPKYVYNIFNKFPETKNYYDFSCGWGERLLCSLGRHINYYGTDPNTDLCHNLNKMTDDYRKFTNDDKTVTDIRNTGSEIYHKDWENKMDLCFSSPPYFNLETYEPDNEKQSIYNRSFDEWINEYMKPTMTNCHRYLKDNGHLVINISNTRALPDIEEPVNKTALESGFELVEKYDMKQTHSRWTGKEKHENFYVYKKKL